MLLPRARIVLASAALRFVTTVSTSVCHQARCDAIETQGIGNGRGDALPCRLTFPLPSRLEITAETAPACQT